MTDTNSSNDRYKFPVVHFVEYKPSGEILSAGMMAIGYLEDMQAEGRNIIFVDTIPSLPNSRVNTSTNEVEPKPNCPAVLNGTTLTGLPVPSRVTVLGQTYEVGDGVLEMEFTTPGVYSVTVESPVFRTGRYEVVV